MNPRKIERDDVAAAMESLESQGVEKPSADAILKELGAGSKNTVLKLRKEVWSEREAAAQMAQEQADAALLDKIPMPDSMARRIKIAQDSIGELALAFAEAITEERISAASTQQDVVDALKHRHAELAKSLRSRIAELEKISAEQASQIELLTAENKMLEKDFEGYENDLKNFKQQNDELKERLIKALEGQQTKKKKRITKEELEKIPVGLQREYIRKNS